MIYKTASTPANKSTIKGLLMDKMDLTERSFPLDSKTSMDQPLPRAKSRQLSNSSATKNAT